MFLRLVMDIRDDLHIYPSSCYNPQTERNSRSSQTAKRNQWHCGQASSQLHGNLIASVVGKWTHCLQHWLHCDGRRKRLAKEGAKDDAQKRVGVVWYLCHLFNSSFRLRLWCFRLASWPLFSPLLRRSFVSHPSIMLFSAFREDTEGCFGIPQR